jgi:hypothetical protein
MPAEFSVHVDPEELEAQRLAAAASLAAGKEDGRQAHKQAKPQLRQPARGKVGGRGQGAQQPRKYAFRRS